MCGHFFGVIGVEQAPGFILLLAGVTEAAALAAVSGTGSNGWPVSLEKMEQTEATYGKRATFRNLQIRHRAQRNVFTCEELSSSAACDEVERDSSDWPRDAALPRPFSNLPLPLLWGGEASESLTAPPPPPPPSSSSSTSREHTMVNFATLHTGNRCYTHFTLEVFWWRVSVLATVNSTIGAEENSFHVLQKQMAW